MLKIVRSEKEWEDLYNRVAEAEDDGTSKFPGMSFEQGILYALRWLEDADEPDPLED